MVCDTAGRRGIQGDTGVLYLILKLEGKKHAQSGGGAECKNLRTIRYT